MRNRYIFPKIISIILGMLIMISISTISYGANISSDEYKIVTKDGINSIIGIYPNTRADTVIANLKSEGTIAIYDNNGKGITDDAIIATGNQIQVKSKTYIAIVCGDVNGDGNVTLTDLVKISAHMIGKEILDGANKIAADVDASGKVTTTDILNLKRLLVRIIENREIFEKKYSNNCYEYTSNKLTDKITITNLVDAGQSGTLQIPSKIDGNEVVGIDGFLGENSKITKITIPSEIKNINSILLSGLTKLKEIQVSDLNEIYSSEDGILYNKTKDTLLFYPRGKLENTHTIKANVKTIGEYAYYKNNAIEKLYIPDTVEEIEKNAFKERNGKIYVKENATIIEKLKENGIPYEIDGKPMILKVTSTEGTNQVITIHIEATDNIGIVAWSIGLKGSTRIWNHVETTKTLKTSYQEVTINGTYEVQVKDTVGNIASQDIIINEIDTSIPRITAMKIISPTSGEYKPGQKIIARVEFSEKIKGTAPTLKLAIGESLSSGQISVSNPTGTQNYIDYIYTTTDNEQGQIAIYSYTGGNITDISGNKASIIKLANTGNQVVIVQPTIVPPSSDLITFACGWSYTLEDLDLICAITAQECGTSYEGALAVITTACNRTVSPKWKHKGSDPLSQYMAPGQFCYSNGTNWRKRLNGNYRDFVRQAVIDALNGKRNHRYLSFRTTGTHEGEDIGGNSYFNPM